MDNPATLISFGSFLWAVTAVFAASISEFAPTLEASQEYVGWDSQSTTIGVQRRFETIGSSIFWACFGVMLMMASQLVTHKVTFDSLDLEDQHSMRAAQTRSTMYE